MVVRVIRGRDGAAMTPPNAEALVDAAVSRILAAPVDLRLAAFAEAMQVVLDELAARYPRSAPRDLARMAKQIGRLVLYRLQEIETSRDEGGRPCP